MQATSFQSYGFWLDHEFYVTGPDQATGAHTEKRDCGYVRNYGRRPIDQPSQWTGHRCSNHRLKR